MRRAQKLLAVITVAHLLDPGIRDMFRTTSLHLSLLDGEDGGAHYGLIYAEAGSLNVQLDKLR